MRASVWSLVVLLFACGKAERNRPDQTNGGASPNNAGATSGSGGATAIAGSAGLTGGNAAQGGGEGGEGGDAGGAGTAATCSGAYLACGCGCCGGVTPTKRCYYPEVAGHLESIVAEDEQLASSSSCANAGCSMGVEYVCCSSEPATPSDATYQVSVDSTAVGSTAVDRLTINRVGADGFCGSITFVNPSAVRNAFLIETPYSWPVESATVRRCAQSSLPMAMGGFGRVDWHLGRTEAGESPCVIDFDFTLFSSTGPDAPEAVRFVAQGLPLRGVCATR